MNFQPLQGAALRAFLLSSTQQEINAYWKQLQQFKRDAGEFHYTQLVDETGTIVERI